MAKAWRCCGGGAPSGNVYYYFQDQIGTSRLIATSSGVVCYDADLLPYGGEMVVTNNCAQNYKFTGLERDPETGLDHTVNRKYNSSLGRWLTPDPLAGDFTNPQSLNLYAYALDNPVRWTDPLGLCPPGTSRVNLADAASKHLNTPYGGPWVQYDGGEIKSMDCTGLVGLAIQDNFPGYGMRHTTIPNIKAGAAPFYPDLNGPQVGDIALITVPGHGAYGHVVIVTGTDQGFASSFIGSNGYCKDGKCYGGVGSVPSTYGFWGPSFHPPTTHPPQFFEVCLPNATSSEGGNGGGGTGGGGGGNIYGLPPTWDPFEPVGGEAGEGSSPNEGGVSGSGASVSSTIGSWEFCDEDPSGCSTC